MHMARISYILLEWVKYKTAIMNIPQKRVSNVYN